MLFDFVIFNRYNVQVTYDLLFTILISALIFLFFLVLKKIFTSFLIGLLSKITSRTKNDLDDYLVTAFEKPLRLFFIFLGLYLALWYLPLYPSMDAWLYKVFRSIIIILIAIGLVRFVGNYTNAQNLNTAFNLNIDTTLLPFLINTIKFVLIALAALIIAEEWQYNISGFVAGLGLGGLAFALAAKDALSNIFGGIIIVTDKPFSIGDWIKTEKIEGIVEDINFRSTRIRSFDHSLIIIPNATLAADIITNYSKMGKRKLTFNFSLSAETEPEKIQYITEELKDFLIQHPHINADTVEVILDGFTDISYSILVYFFTSTTKWSEYIHIKEEVNFKILEILDKHDVTMTFINFPKNQRSNI